MNNTIKIEATIGVNAGYNHENKDVDDFYKIVMDCIELCYSKKGVAVSFVINKSITCYRKEFGCPDNGEITYTLSTVMNPFFQSDKLKYLDVAEYILYEISQYYNQSTMTVTTYSDDCHTGENHKPGGVLYDWMLKARKVKQYKEPPFMNILRRRIFKTYLESIITYGSETTPKRKSLGLEKTHYNDAIVISGISNIRKDTDVWFEFRQFRKKKRSLHEANPRKGRKSPNVYAVRNAKNTKEHKGWYLNDKVSLLGKVGWICGFASGGCYVKDIHGEYITLPGKSYKQVGLGHLKFICHNNTWQYAIHPIS